jgi:hypothetical protein
VTPAVTSVSGIPIAHRLDQMDKQRFSSPDGAALLLERTRSRNNNKLFRNFFPIPADHPIFQTGSERRTEVRRYSFHLTVFDRGGRRSLRGRSRLGYMHGSCCVGTGRPFLPKVDSVSLFAVFYCAGWLRPPNTTAMNTRQLLAQPNPKEASLSRAHSTFPTLNRGPREKNTIGQQTTR